MLVLVLVVVVVVVVVVGSNKINILIKDSVVLFALLVIVVFNVAVAAF
jgi:hypothetical protein